jgi:hypothetical protein
MKSKTKQLTRKVHLSAKQAAIAGSFDRSELYNLLRSGAIKGERVGWLCLVNTKSLIAYCKTHGRTLIESALETA